MNAPCGWQNGLRIREIRKQQGLKVVELARKVELKPGSLTNIERNNRPASLAKLIEIATALDTPILDILKPDAPWRATLIRSGIGSGS